MDHALVGCPEVKEVWTEEGRWWNVDVQGCETLRDSVQIGDSMSGRDVDIWSWIKSGFLYLIWSNRNYMVFKGVKGRIRDLVLEFQKKCFEWVKERDNKRDFDWNSWLQNQ